MRLLEVGIKNFKSLRDVTFKPGDLSVLIGPNGAGKSNICERLDPGRAAINSRSFRRFLRVLGDSRYADQSRLPNPES